jgi:ArsR family transcriptional regulator
MDATLQTEIAQKAAPNTSLTNERRTAILKALADPRRFELLEQIAKARCKLNCSAARGALPISAATLSHHVKELEAAGLIRIEREGKFHLLSIDPGVLEAIAETLQSLSTGGCPPPPSPSQK